MYGMQVTETINIIVWALKQFGNKNQAIIK
jgi:hypothetical protein